jgi:hypothetical protein
MGFVASIHAQQITNLPYSRYGLGQSFQSGTVRNLAMGGAGIASFEQNTVHVLNPAGLAGNPYTFADASFLLYRNFVTQGNSFQMNNSSSLGYIFLSAAVSKRWNVMIGLTNGSEVKFNYKDRLEAAGISSSNVERELRGTGNLSNLHLAQGIKLSKKLSVGAQATYEFGSLDYQNSYRLEINGRLEKYKTVLLDINRYNNLRLKGGVLYRIEDTDNQVGRAPVVYSLAATAEAGWGLRNSRLLIFQRWNAEDDVPFLFDDTVQFNGSNNLTIPLALQAGFSAGRQGQWMTHVDAGYTFWDQYANAGRSEPLFNAASVRVGGLWIPNQNSGYFKRVGYRLGGYLAQTALIIDNQRINDIGITFGLSLPVDKLSRLNLALMYGNRGLESATTVREQYLQLSVSYSLVDRWFVRYRTD